jgi:small redox-active disulfide protein 2
MKRIQILGTGCPKCKKLAENAEQAARDLALDCRIEKVTAVNDIMKFGVMMTPALVAVADQGDAPIGRKEHRGGRETPLV